MDEHFDEQYRKQTDEEAWPPQQKQQTSGLLKLTALIVLVAFLVLTLNNVLQIFTLPSFDFIMESRKLSKDPFIQELQGAVVQVQVKARTQNNAELRGTGFNIKPEGLIITNSHLVENAVSVIVTFPGRKAYKAVKWSAAPMADLAVITLQGESLPSVDLEESLPAVGEAVTVIGNPLNFIKVVMRGEVIKYWQVEELPEPLLEIDVPVKRGSSGSPVFNGEGRATAVIFATVEGAGREESRGLALPVSLLQDLWN